MLRLLRYRESERYLHAICILVDLYCFHLQRPGRGSGGSATPPSGFALYLSLSLFNSSSRKRSPTNLSIAISLRHDESRAEITFARSEWRRINETLNTETNPRDERASAFFDSYRRLVIARLNEVSSPTTSTAKSFCISLRACIYPEKDSR